METKKCKKCQENIKYKAKKCPKCGANQGDPLWAKIIVGIAIFSVLSAIISGNNGDTSSQSLKNPEESTHQSDDNNSKSNTKESNVPKQSESEFKSKCK